MVTAVTGLIYFGFYHSYIKKNPSQGTDITKKDVEVDKTPQTDKTELADIQADLPVVYEDAMCNPAYETTEIEGEEDENEDANKKPQKNQNGEL